MSVWHIKGEIVENLLKEGILQIPSPWMPFFNFELSVTVIPQVGDIIILEDYKNVRKFILNEITPVYVIIDEKREVKNYDCQYLELNEIEGGE